MTTLHFITGKGGVGRSTVAAALATRLSESGEGPVLLLEVQGSGRSLQLCGLEGPKPYLSTPLPALRNAWGARLLPKDTFRQYFGRILALGNEASSFGALTAGLRERLLDTVVENRVVSAFIDVCPGLEPVVLLGKIHFEAAQGKVPESNETWRHVIVDGPATGHALALFRSTNALREIFGTGPIHRQTTDVMDFMRDRARTRILVVTLPEELPVRETLDLRAGLEAMGLAVSTFVMNRCSPELAPNAAAPLTDAVWAREAAFERDSLSEQQGLYELLKSRLRADERLIRLPEIFAEQPAEIAAKLATELSS